MGNYFLLSYLFCNRFLNIKVASEAPAVRSNNFYGTGIFVLFIVYILKSKVFSLKTNHRLDRRSFCVTSIRLLL